LTDKCDVYYVCYILEAAKCNFWTLEKQDEEDRAKRGSDLTEQSQVIANVVRSYFFLLTLAMICERYGNMSISCHLT